MKRNREKSKKCKVSEYDAFLAETSDRTYLCRTRSPKTSCVIEFIAHLIAETDIVRMAESIASSENDIIIPQDIPPDDH